MTVLSVESKTANEKGLLLLKGDNTMKKAIAISLTAAIMISMTACANNSTDELTESSPLESGTQTESEGVTEVGVDVLDYDGHSFACFFGCQTWEEARDQCEGMGGHLAVITSQEEDEALFAFTRYCGYDNVYIGYSDVEEEGNWQWVTGETSDYSNWNEGEPNGFTPNENYAVYGGNGAWYDGEFTPRIENGLISFICEWDYHVDGATNISSEELQTYIDGLEEVAIDTEEDEQNSSLDEAELQANRVAAYTKYLGILESAEESIRSYDDLDGLNCALIDVTGDGIEDLIYLCNGDEAEDWFCIRVYSYNRFTTSAPVVLQLDYVSDFSDAGYEDGFIAVTNDGDFVIFHNNSSCYFDWEFIECSVYSFDGAVFPSDPSLHLLYRNDEFSSPCYSYGWGTDISEEEFNSYEETVLNSLDVVLYYDDISVEYMNMDHVISTVSSLDSIAMTYNDMHALLASYI